MGEIGNSFRVWGVGSLYLYFYNLLGWVDSNPMINHAQFAFFITRAVELENVPCFRSSSNDDWNLLRGIDLGIHFKVDTCFFCGVGDVVVGVLVRGAAFGRTSN